MNQRRTPRFSVQSHQEDLLTDLNQRLQGAERSAVQDLPDEPRLPMVFVVGPPRSGTTLTMQWLADSGQFAYPTNLLARFYAAPYTGAQIQLLTQDPEYDFHGELSGPLKHSAWDSETGKTSGPLQPHEFSYFWRRFFPLDQARPLTSSEWVHADRAGFAKGWAALETAFGKPMAAKGILGQYNLVQLARLLPTAVFIHTHRDPFYNVQSLLAARERVYGTRNAWFSVQQPGFERLLTSDPIEQVVDQVMTTNYVLAQSANILGHDRWINQPYRTFCQDPQTTFNGLRRAFTFQGYDLEDSFRSEPFGVTDKLMVNPDDEAAIRAHIDSWQPRT